MRLSVTVKNAELVRTGLENLALEIPLIGRRQIYNSMRKIRAIVNKPGKAINYPVKWDSEKQRRAYFATDGFGRGIPTKRTGAYIEGWNIVSTDRGYILTNQTPGAIYLSGGAYGNRQSNIHKGRWPILRDAADEVIATLPEEISAEINMVTRREGLK